MVFLGKKLQAYLEIALLGASLAWVTGCAELRTFVQMNPSDVVGTELDSPCVVITKSQPLQQVKACDQKNHLKIVAPAWVRTYKKDLLQHAVTDLHTQFATNPKLGPHGLTGAGADIWLDVALTDPNDVRFVLLFRTENGFVLLREPLDLSLWRVDRENLVFIPEFKYPSLRARKMGVVQLVPYSDVTRTQIERVLNMLGKKSSTWSFTIEGTWPYLMLKTTPFLEADLVRGLGQQPRARDLIEDVIYVPAGEREGAKYRLMTMDIMSPSYGLR